MGTLKTLHVVGYKNSGKTTLIARWVRLLAKEGVRVAVLKHHGHHSPLDMPNEKTDAMQFYGSGAQTSVVAGGGAVQLYMNEEPGFNSMKAIATIANPDILLIEGYKEERGEKVVLLRDENDWEDLQHLQGIQLIVGPVDEATIPSRIAHEQLDRWLMSWLKGKDTDETI